MRTLRREGGERMGEEVNGEFELNEVADNIEGSVGSRLSWISREYGLGNRKWSSGTKLKVSRDCYRSFVINPNGRYICTYQTVSLASQILHACPSAKFG